MLKLEMVFGKPQAWLYSIEWQKRGLPHCHLLLWLSADHRITPDKIDDVICAEIPDPSVDLELHQIVISNMVHGPVVASTPIPLACRMVGVTKSIPSNTWLKHN